MGALGAPPHVGRPSEPHPRGHGAIGPQGPPAAAVEHAARSGPVLPRAMPAVRLHTTLQFHPGQESANSWHDALYPRWTICASRPLLLTPFLQHLPIYSDHVRPRSTDTDIWLSAARGAHLFRNRQQRGTVAATRVQNTDAQTGEQQIQTQATFLDLLLEPRGVRSTTPPSHPNPDAATAVSQSPTAGPYLGEGGRARHEVLHRQL